MKRIKKSVACVIYNNSRTKVLVVQRPKNDEDLPNIWGLPAASLKEKESFEKAVLRSGKEKLGAELKIIRFIKGGQIKRGTYILRMKLYEVEIVQGKPNVPQKIKGITQYQKLSWNTPNKLKEAVQKGSLCSQLYLSSISFNWK